MGQSKKNGKKVSQIWDAFLDCNYIFVLVKNFELLQFECFQS